MTAEALRRLADRATAWLSEVRSSVARSTGAADAAGQDEEPGRILPPDLGPVTIRGVDHLEWYVGNARHTAVWLERLGFTTIARQGPDTGVQDLDSLLVAAGGIRILLTSGLTPNHDATRAVAHRGDAIHDLAFSVDDVEVAYGRCVGAGLEPDHLPVTLVGRSGQDAMSLIPVTTRDEVLHTLVARPHGITDSADFAPGFVRVGSGTADGGRIGRVVALTTVVAPGRLDAVVEQYLGLFELVEVERSERDGVTLSVLAAPDDVSSSESGPVIATGALRLVFTSPSARRERNHLDDFLAQHRGSGLRSVTLATDDLADVVADWRSAGIAFLDVPEERAGDAPDDGAVTVAVAGDREVRRAIVSPLQPRTPVVIAVEEAADGVVACTDLAHTEEAALAGHRSAHLPVPPLGTWGGGR